MFKLGTKNISTLEEDIFKLLGGKSLFNLDIIDRFGDNVKQTLISRLNKEEREVCLRMSNLGRPLRQLWYELKNYPKEEPDGKTLLKFAYGDLVEALVLALAEVAGHKVERLQEEVELDGVKGHIDAVIDGVLVDVKSCSPYSYNKFKTGQIFTDDPFGYIAQLSGYASVLGLPAGWIPVNKVLGDISFVPLPEEKVKEYDVESRIRTVKGVISSSVPPDRCFSPEPDGKSGNLKLGITCSYCGYKDECWSDANNGAGLKTYIYSTGPKYLVQVMKEPRVGERSNQFKFPVKEENNNNEDNS